MNECLTGRGVMGWSCEVAKLRLSELETFNLKLSNFSALQTLGTPNFKYSIFAH
jgi:hypothetical protein